MENKLLENYISFLLVENNCSNNTIIKYKKVVEDFLKYFYRSKNDISMIEKKDLLDYQTGLYELEYEKSSISNTISVLKSFLKYLYINNITKIDLRETLLYPKKNKKIPNFLTENEMKMVFGSMKKDDPLSFRNYLLVLFIYSTGLRVSELCNLNTNISGDELIITSKGGKQRIIFLNRVLIAQLNIYLTVHRPTLLKTKNSDKLFLNKNGGNLTQRGVRDIFERIFLSIEVKGSYSPHDVRHSIATHLLNNKMELRHIQEFLGHSSLSTTQIYTHTSNKEIKTAYLNNVRR